MATAEDYAKWIVANKDKKGTPEFETVSKAYQMAKGGQSTTQPAQQPAPEPKGFLRRAGDVAMEAVTGADRAITGGIDMLVSDPINGALQLAGSDTRVPTLSSFIAPKGAFAGEGLAADIAAGVGATVPAALSVGAGLRTMAQNLSPLARQSESAVRGIVRQAGDASQAADLGYGVAAGVGSGVGENVGGDTGALIGSILAPVGAAGAKNALSGILSMGSKGVLALNQSLSRLSDAGAGKLLADAMVREGISPDDVAKRLAELGPEAIPADVANGFARVLRAASNEIPRIEGRARNVLNERQAGQTTRINEGMDDATGLNLSLEDELARLDMEMKPQISALYAKARSAVTDIPQKIQKLFAGDNSIGQAAQSARVQTRLKDMAAAGDEVTNFDLINAVKMEVDDQIGAAIRQGEMNRVRDLTRLKNTMIEEADAAIPGYAEARNMYAGKASMENAANLGKDFFKTKLSDMRGITRSMGDAEKRMYRLGARQAIIDRASNLQMNADAVMRMFGKNGDVEKLKYLFDDAAAFNRFADTLKRESQFVLTRRAAQGNSTTAKQLADMGGLPNAMDAMDSARMVIGDPAAAASMFTRLTRGFAEKRGTRAYNDALEKAGDILLESGYDPKKLRNLLAQGDAARLKALLEPVLIQPSHVLSASVGAGAAQASKFAENRP